MSIAEKAALAYLARGWAPIPIPTNTKAPKFHKWESLTVAAEDVPELWRNAGNVGILLGPRSGGLVDIDLDAPEARACAELFLPPTGCVFGRPSSPRSHRLYVAMRPLETEKFADPEARRDDVQRAMLVELRSAGAQTVLPPSQHSGEFVAFDLDGEPAAVEGPELRAAVARLAACALLARHWFPRGSRHEGSMALAGMLARAGWDVDDAAAFIGTAASIYGDDEVPDRIRAANDTFEQLDADEPTTGVPRLEALLPRAVLSRLLRWTAYEDGAALIVPGEDGTAPQNTHNNSPQRDDEKRVNRDEKHFVHFIDSVTNRGGESDAARTDESDEGGASPMRARAWDDAARIEKTSQNQWNTRNTPPAQNTRNGEPRAHGGERVLNLSLNGTTIKGPELDIIEEWQSPLAFTAHHCPPFPLDALPSWLGTFVDAQATALQVPTDVPAMIALAVLATTVAKKATVYVREDWEEPANVYTVACLPPGERKSGVFQQSVKPLLEWEAAQHAQCAAEIAEAEASRAALEAKKQRLINEAARAESEKYDAALADAQQVARELASTKTPAAPRLLAEDCTPERLVTLMAQQGGRIAVLSDEGSIFEIMAGRYSSAPNFGIFLKAHSGTDYLVDRVGRPSEHIKAPALTLGLTVQPDVIAGLATTKSFRGKGLLARFLFAVPHSKIGSRVDAPPAIPAPVRAEYGERIAALLALMAPGGAEPLYLSREAAETFATFRIWLEPQLGDAGALASIRDWGGKLAGAVARIAGLLHLATWAGHAAPWQEPIAHETMAAAVSIGRYLIPHAQAAFGMMGADPDVEHAKAVLAWIERKRPTRFSRRDVYADLRSRFARVEAADEPLAVLTEHNFIRAAQTARRRGPGRKPSQEYDVNPALYGNEEEPW